MSKKKLLPLFSECALRPFARWVCSIGEEIITQMRIIHSALDSYGFLLTHRRASKVSRCCIVLSFARMQHKGKLLIYAVNLGNELVKKIANYYSCFVLCFCMVHGAYSFNYVSYFIYCWPRMHLSCGEMQLFHYSGKRVIYTLFII
jgi:hypothetical protein